MFFSRLLLAALVAFLLTASSAFAVADDTATEGSAYAPVNFKGAYSAEGPVGGYFTCGYGSDMITWGDGTSERKYDGAYATAYNAPHVCVYTMYFIQHTYSAPGRYAVQSTQETRAVSVADAALTGEPQTLPSIPQGGATAAPTKVASFTSAWAAEPVSHFTATVNWGDGTALAAATVTATGIGGRFDVTAPSHTYNVSGNFDIAVKINQAAPALSPTITSHVTVIAPDVTAPTAPSALTASFVSVTGMRLSWGASTDARGVTGYRLYRTAPSSSATPIAVLGAGATQTDLTSLTSTTNYTFQLSAVDATGNESARATVTQRTLDGVAPSAPSSLTASTITSTAVTLDWPGSTDDTSVTGYRVTRTSPLPSTQLLVVGNSLTISGLTEGTSYTFQVTALDAAGNESTPSAPLTVTPAAPPVVVTPPVVVSPPPVVVTTPPAGDTTAPILTKAGTFLKKYKVGSRVTFQRVVTVTSSERGTATLTFSRKVGRHWVRVTPVVQKLKVAPGSNTLRLPLALRNKLAAPGQYRVSVRVTDAAGNAATAKPVAFSVRAPA